MALSAVHRVVVVVVEAGVVEVVLMQQVQPKCTCGLWVDGLWRPRWLKRLFGALSDLNFVVLR